MNISFNSSYIKSRQDILQHVKGINLNILDIGCATGENGKYLIDNGLASKVIGVEYVEEMAKEAKGKLFEVLTGSIEDDEILGKLKLFQSFDYVLLGDVLEHLVNPWRVLLELSKLLKANGKVILSTPNVQHVEVLIQVFFKGSWPLNKRGIFDETHLRWFTLKDLKKMVDGAGLKTDVVVRKFRFRDALGTKFPWWSSPIRKLVPSLFTHQYVIVASTK